MQLQLPLLVISRNSRAGWVLLFDSCKALNCCSGSMCKRRCGCSCMDGACDRSCCTLLYVCLAGYCMLSDCHTIHSNTAADACTCGDQQNQQRHEWYVHLRFVIQGVGMIRSMLIAQATGSLPLAWSLHDHRSAAVTWMQTR